ncbi:hypothetical protein [Thiosocius teredinicola]|uniref:hypothetical protein n=1 Tax=Thiosocius teredinicola TaxID=1973002 RepID=UPI000990D86C
MAELADDLLSQLVELIDRLRDESADFLDQPGDQQAWYNRGYANGMLTALVAIGVAGRLGTRTPDDVDAIQAHETMPWGKAYRHGEQVGSRETYEITGNQPS